MIVILNKLLSDYPSSKKIILWSDSCVPQNRNKIFATAIKYFLRKNKLIIEIVQKFCIPGHSQIQDVDSLHSCIDKYLKNVEIPSIISLIRLLKNIRYKAANLQIMQMKSTDFLTFSKKSDYLNFQTIPFSKVRFLLYKQNEPFSTDYKLSGSKINYKSESIFLRPSRSKLGTPKNLFEQHLDPIDKPQHPADKKKDINSLLRFLLEADQQYYTLILKIKE